MDKNKLIYDLSLICVKQCLSDIQPVGIDDTCEYAIEAFENSFKKLSDSIEPVLERINA